MSVHGLLTIVYTFRYNHAYANVFCIFKIEHGDITILATSDFPISTAGTRLNDINTSAYRHDVRTGIAEYFQNFRAQFNHVKCIVNMSMLASSRTTCIWWLSPKSWALFPHRTYGCNPQMGVYNECDNLGCVTFFATPINLDVTLNLCHNTIRALS